MGKGGYQMAKGRLPLDDLDHRGNVHDQGTEADQGGTKALHLSAKDNPYFPP